MKISDRSYPADPPDMQPLKIEHALVLLEGFEFWQLFGDFFGYLEMYAIDDYHFMGSFGKIQLYLLM